MDKIKVVKIVIKIIAIVLIIQSIRNIINDWDSINELSKTIVILLLIANAVVLIVLSMRKNINKKFIVRLVCYIIVTFFMPVYSMIFNEPVPALRSYGVNSDIEIGIAPAVEYVTTIYKSIYGFEIKEGTR